jgi:hypothetical protein
MTGCWASPEAMSWSTVILTWSLGIANPTPMLPDCPPTLPEETWAMAEFTPMTSPERLSSGPPELPGLIAASVCSALM